MKFSVVVLGAALTVPFAASAEKPWWAQEPLRIIDLATNMTRIDYREPALLTRQKAALGFNAEHLQVMGTAGGLSNLNFFFRTRLAGSERPDYLGRYMPEARKNGLRVFVYFNVHWYTMVFASQHPDWRMIRENGQPLDKVYDTGADFCVNTPWREWVFEILRNLAAEGIDGIFFDGPLFFPDACYCKYCRAKFQKLYGRDIPTKTKRTGKDYAQLVEFQANSLKEFLRDSNRILKGIRQELAFYINGGVRGSNGATGRLNRVLVEEQDLLGSEGGFIGRDLTRVPLWKPGLTARMLETQAGGKPTIIFSAASHKPWTYSLLPGPELKLLYADTIANGAGVWMGITPFEFEEPEMQALAEMNRFVEKNKAYYREAKSEARVGVVWSDVTANFYSGSVAQFIDLNRPAPGTQIGSLDGEFGGITESLLRAHVPFDVLDDVSLEKEPLDRYRAIFLPNVACMSDKVAARLKKYVENGGNVFADFETSLYDETGVRRADFALAGVFGANALGKLAGPRNFDYMRVAAEHELLANGVKREFIPSPTYYVPVKANAGQVVLKYTVRLAGTYDGVPKTSDDPGLMVNRVGKGSVIYMSGDLGNTISTFHTPELMRLAANVGRQFGGSLVQVENAAGSVEVVVRSQQGGRRMLVHLVNFTGEMTRPICQVETQSRVRLTMDGGTAFTRASTLWGGKRLEVTRDAKGRTQVAVPGFGEYEVVVLER